jgi:hypothetical protein
VNNLYSLLFLFVLILPSAGCNAVTFGWEGEDSRRVEGIEGPLGGHFDEEGNWIPDNPDIAMTYKIPDISAGFIVDIASALETDSRHKVEFLSPSLQIELLEFKTYIPYVRTLKLDFGVAYQRAFFYVGKLWTNIFEISTGLFVGWDWSRNELSFGIGATVIKF